MDRRPLRRATRVCDNQAFWLTNNFNFTIERAGGWPLINAVAAYRHTGNPYYLNAARLMVQRCLERQDPATGGWLHYPPVDETGDVPTLGGKAFATGILSYGVLRYLDTEPQPRPEVRRMLVRAGDWLMRESWVPQRGFRYINWFIRDSSAGTSFHPCQESVHPGPPHPCLPPHICDQDVMDIGSK